MAQGIEDLGNGLGWLYKTLADGTTVVGNERNTIDGTRAMQQMGVANAPVVAARSSQGKITVTGSGGAGSITNVDVLGVNQIVAPIVVTSATTSVVAEQIANAINAYSAPGYQFTALAVNSIVYMYSAPQDGSVINGSTITVTATDPGLTFTTENFANGSSEIGVYDTEFGYRFWIDADYSGSASPTTIGPKAVEITQYITVRGSQSGIITISKSVASDRLIGMTRACDTTQVILDTQSSAATDILAFIQADQFVEGDVLRIRGADPTRVVTIQDASVTTSPIATPNIKTTDAVPFSLSGLNSIALQYRNDPNLGPVWVETGRSLSGGVILSDKIQFDSDANLGILKPNQLYFIQDLGNAGTFLRSLENDSYSTSGTMRRYVPINYVSGWTPGLTPVLNNYYRYGQIVYQSITGANPTTPPTDLVNWLPISTSNATYYSLEFHDVQVVGNNTLSSATQPIMEETDQFDNVIRQSSSHFNLSGVNAYEVFCWMPAVSPLQNVSGNFVQDGVFRCSEFTASTIARNTVTNNGTINTSYISGNCSNNVVIGGSVTNNYISNFVGNLIKFGGVISNNGTSSGVISDINANTVLAGSIINNNSSVIVGGLILTSLVNGGIISSNTFSSNSGIRYAEVNTYSSITSGTFSSGSRYDNVIAKNSSVVQLTLNTGGISNGLVCENSSVNISAVNNVQNSYFTNSTVTWTNATTSSGNNVFINSSVVLDGNIDDKVYIGQNSANTITEVGGSYNVNGVGGSSSTTLDLDNPAIFAAGVLTIPLGYYTYNTFGLISSVNRIITNIVNLPNYQKTIFYNATLGLATFTFNVTPRAAFTGTEILGVANFTLESTSGPSDYLTIASILTAPTIIETVKPS